MKFGFKPLGILCMVFFGYSSVFCADIPREVKELRDKAIADGKEVCVSAETLKTNYTILEANENMQTATYKVADMPRKGVQATVIYRSTPDDLHKARLEAGKQPERVDGEEHKKWYAAVLEKRRNFSKQFPESVVCVEEKAGVQTKFVFVRGVLSLYLRHFDELTQAVLIRFHSEYQVGSELFRVTNGYVSGLMYRFDEKDNITEIDDYGPPCPERRSSIKWNENNMPISWKEMDDAFQELAKEMKKDLPDDD